MKRLSLSLIAIILAFALTACAGASGSSAAQPAESSASQEKPVTLKLGHLGTQGDAYYQGAEKFKELAESYSNGSITVEVYPNSELASGTDAVQGCQMGTIDIVLESSMTISNFVSNFGVLDLPFIFQSYEQAYKVLDGDVGQALEADAEAQGFKVLHYWNNGFRNISNGKRPINSVQDLKGLKIRVPNSEVYLKTFEILEAIPTPMNWSEVFSSLQLGAIDGQENPNGHMISYNLTEVQKYFTITNHIYTAEPLIMNLDRFNGLSAAQQEALLKAAKESGEFERTLREQRNNEDLQKIKDAGIEVTTPDLNAFKSAVQPVYAQYGTKYGDLLKRIQAITG